MFAIKSRRGVEARMTLFDTHVQAQVLWFHGAREVLLGDPN